MLIIDAGVQMTVAQHHAEQPVVLLARVSTKGQTHSPTHQIEACRDFCNRNNLTVVGEFIEIGSGGLPLEQRPILKQALELCERTGARLVLNKLSRLSRKVSFIATLLDQNTRFYITDMGFREVSTFELHLLASFAQMERERISQRTKEGLRIAARTKKLGNPNPRPASLLAAELRQEKADQFAESVLPIVDELKRAGITTLSGIARALTCRGIKTSNGGKWYATTVRNLMHRKAQVLSS
jgi:DNA invertase Pin-like site-specific DNA recombinase